jgi:RimJ/RimL family protein N-acetyltransferase
MSRRLTLQISATRRDAADRHCPPDFAALPTRGRAARSRRREAGLKPFEGGGSDVELGYAFGAAYWGRGYATEAGHAIVREASGPLDLKRLVAVTSDDNNPSQHVLHKLGFRADGRRKVYGRDLLHFVRERDDESRA